MRQEKESNKFCKTLYWFGYYGEKNVLMKFGNLKDIGDGQEIRLVLQDNCLKSEGELEKN